MTPPSPTYEYSEQALEQTTLKVFTDLGWETKNLCGEWMNGTSSEGRRK